MILIEIHLGLANLRSFGFSQSCLECLIYGCRWGGVGLWISVSIRLLNMWSWGGGLDFEGWGSRTREDFWILGMMPSVDSVFFLSLSLPETWVTTNSLRLTLLVLRTCQIYRKCESSPKPLVVGRMESSLGKSSRVAASLTPLDLQSKLVGRNICVWAVLTNSIPAYLSFSLGSLFFLGCP